MDHSLPSRQGEGLYAWSADGQHILYAVHDSVLPAQVWRADFESGGNPVQLAHNLVVSNIAASPDGLHIAFIGAARGSAGGSGIDQIFVMDLDGANVVGLTPLVEVIGPLSWSPDSQLISTNGES